MRGVVSSRNAEQAQLPPPNLEHFQTYLTQRLQNLRLIQLIAVSTISHTP